MAVNAKDEQIPAKHIVRQPFCVEIRQRIAQFDLNQE